MNEKLSDALMILGIAGITYGIYIQFGQGWAAITGGAFALALGIIGNLVRTKNVVPN